MATDNSIIIHQYQDDTKAVVVEFGKGKIGIGLDNNSYRNLAVHLQELNKEKEVGAFLTKEEKEDNFKNQSNQLEVILCFPDLKSIDNFIETLKIYRREEFFPNARTRHG